uniref:Putative secreted protein n=1 Tax=Anopheles marajoara TaxID=58244 RepID=A0A2M4C625_9DIPT
MVGVTLFRTFAVLAGHSLGVFVGPASPGDPGIAGAFSLHPSPYRATLFPSHGPSSLPPGRLSVRSVGSVLVSRYALHPFRLFSPAYYCYFCVVKPTLNGRTWWHTNRHRNRSIVFVALLSSCRTSPSYRLPPLHHRMDRRTRFSICLSTKPTPTVAVPRSRNHTHPP